MKRDMDLIRDILLRIEEGADDLHTLAERIPGTDYDRIAGHFQVLLDAGYVTGTDASSHEGTDFQMIRLTWAGHEFLDNARNDTIWHKVKEELSKRSMTVSVDLLQQLLIKFMQSWLNTNIGP